MTTREAARIINAIKCSMVTTPEEHEALTIAERVLWKAEPVKHGRWIWLDGVRCSICNHKLQTSGLPSYCPNCGAKMDEEASHEQRID